MQQQTSRPDPPVRQKVSMLEYCMTILGKLSFDRKLFRKEYLKALRCLKPAEQKKLRTWVLENQRQNEPNHIKQIEYEVAKYSEPKA